MKNQILLCALLSFANVWAADCEFKPNGPIIEAVSAEPNRQLNCDFLSDVEKQFENILSFSEDKVPVNLYVRSMYDGASFDAGTLIDLPERLVFYDKWGQATGVPTVSNLTVVAHEYGHALLEKKIERELGKEFPIVKSYIEAHKEISALQLQLSHNPTSKEVAKLLKEKEELLKNNLPLTKFFVLTTPYSELYADVVAVFADDAKDAIFSALYYDSMSKFEFRYVQTRSFATEFNSSYETYMTEAHGYFAYTRTFIGKNFWPENENEKRVYLKKIGDAVISELRFILKNDKELLDFRDGNARLIKTLRNMK